VGPTGLAAPDPGQGLPAVAGPSARRPTDNDYNTTTHRAFGGHVEKQQQGYRRRSTRQYNRR
jgi:hypothetical protein